ncbi:MAG: hypothetical protein IJW29_01250 [Clostridia bacterium]|nr:hypothetical protein [Clostridia bacterium]
MKKILALLAVLVLMLSFSACRNMDYYEDNLKENDYKIETFSNSELEEFASYFELDPDDYNIEEAFAATNRDSGIIVYVMECGSAKDAKNLVEDSDVIIDFLEEVYSSKYSFDAINKGKFVFIGEEDAIEDALDK